NSSAALAPLLQATRTVPIVFTTVVDPVGAGYVDSLAQPGGNATGFILFEYSTAAKWLELLKEIAPHVTRAAVPRESAIAAGPGMLGVMQAAARCLGVDLRGADVRDAREIERAITAFAQGSNSGMIVTGGPGAIFHRDLLIALAARHRLPAVYGARYFAVAGGLASYGADAVDQLRRASGYVDRILKGEKPADFPGQAPTKSDLVINLKTGKAPGPEIPPPVPARAEEVMEGRGASSSRCSAARRSRGRSRRARSSPRGG